MARPKGKPVFSSGIGSLDEILQGVWAGDNVVWQVAAIEDQLPFVDAFCRQARTDGKKLLYFRFGRHQPLVPAAYRPEVYRLQPENGFEPFITTILDVIAADGRGACYVFDSLSGLAEAWHSDRMLGNFFRLACPYLYATHTVAYFVLLRNAHTPLSIGAIHNTAQIVLDLYCSPKGSFIQPLKVSQRHSPTMYMLHALVGEKLTPVTSSVVVSEILASSPRPWLDGSVPRYDPWARTLSEARQLCQRPKGRQPVRKIEAMRRKLIRMMISKSDKVGRLCEKYFQLDDLVAIGKRTVGTGMIGGKSTGMLLARAILGGSGGKWAELLEVHDSFFIGTDVFYTFVINSKCWWERHQMKSSADSVAAAKEIREKLLQGKFPRDIVNNFREILNYFGQSPIIVRSSSLLEDAYGNAFSGKYESVFCSNQGSPEERLLAFKKAVRTVYASTVNPEVLTYRAHRGLWQREEEMALLVQRVSGAVYGRYYLPQLAGVGYSFNPFAWNRAIDPAAGVLRLVFGLGTRAVDRHDDDYTRIVALNLPHKRPEANPDEVHRFSQHIVDLIDLTENRQTSREFEAVAGELPGMPLHLFAETDEEMERRAENIGLEGVFSLMLTFTDLFNRTALIDDIRAMLTTLAEAYAHPVDVEFTVNFIDDRRYRINLLQCRPFQVKMEVAVTKLPENIAPEDIILKTAGPILGAAVARQIHRILYVEPQQYSALNTSERYSLARLIGDITNALPRGENTMLIGPGRWGSTMPELGIPVTFNDIKNVSVLCELAIMHENLSPDISLGTHFFNDLVEMEIVYLGVFPDREGYLLCTDLLLAEPDTLAAEYRGRGRAASALRLLDFSTTAVAVQMHTNPLAQQGIVFRVAGKP
jgi:pyruvate, water dikinase